MAENNKADNAKKTLELPPVDKDIKVVIHAMTLKNIESIGAAHAQRLAEAGIKSLKGLFKRGATREGRQEIATEAGINEHLILEWVSRADLLRVRGIGPEYATLLEEAGVDTPVELAHRQPKNLRQQMAEVNQEKRLSRRLPSEKQVKNWVKEAKKLPRVVEY